MGCHFGDLNLGKQCHITTGALDCLGLLHVPDKRVIEALPIWEGSCSRERRIKKGGPAMDTSFPSHLLPQQSLVPANMEHVGTREEGREGERSVGREKRWELTVVTERYRYEWFFFFFFIIFWWKSRKWSHCTNAHEAMLCRHLTLVPGQSILPMEEVSLLYMKRDWKAFHTLKLAREAHKAVAIFSRNCQPKWNENSMLIRGSPHPPLPPANPHSSGMGSRGFVSDGEGSQQEGG